LTVFDDTHDAWTDRLSEYVDGELDAAERAALDVHLQVCPACARTVTELRAVATRAAELTSPEPAEDLWPGICERLAAPERGAEPRARRAVLDLAAWRERSAATASRRWSFTLPQLAAAAVLLVVLSSLSAWWTFSRRPVVPTATPMPGTTQAASFETARYEVTIAELERVLREHRGELDPATVQIIERNLNIIDAATEQARRALAADPSSPYLNGHLATQLRRKVTLLRQATAMVAAYGS
jgi:anti-sigma factor RsiW